MATTKSAPIPSAVSLPMQETILSLPCTVAFRRPQHVQVVLVGCGGTGARVAALLPKMLRRGDSLLLVDPDTVELKNLTRQHFIMPDVGMPKVEAIARRLLGECARVGVHITAHSTPFSLAATHAWQRERAAILGDGWHGVRQRHPYGTIILGCTDNKAARADIFDALSSFQPAVWIDAGNEMRAGQVMLTARSWPILQLRNELGVLVASSMEAAEGTPIYHDRWSAQIMALPTHFPNLLEREAPPAPGADCPDAIDLQSLTANNLAAAWMGTMLGWFLDELPTSVGGLTYSALGSVEPYLLKRAITPPYEGRYNWVLVT